MCFCVSLHVLCIPTGGPAQGKPCVFPFGFGNRPRTACITDTDPEVAYTTSSLPKTIYPKLRKKFYYLKPPKLVPAFLNLPNLLHHIDIVPMNFLTCRTSSGPPLVQHQGGWPGQPCTSEWGVGALLTRGQEEELREIGGERRRKEQDC